MGVPTFDILNGKKVENNAARCDGGRRLQRFMTKIPEILNIQGEQINRLGLDQDKANLPDMNSIAHRMKINKTDFSLVQVMLYDGLHFRGVTIINGKYLMYDGITVGGGKRLKWISGDTPFASYWVTNLWYKPYKPSNHNEESSNKSTDNDYQKDDDQETTITTTTAPQLFASKGHPLPSSGTDNNNTSDKTSTPASSNKSGNEAASVVNSQRFPTVVEMCANTRHNEEKYISIVTKLFQKILETKAHVQLEQFDTVYEYTFSEHGPMNGYICESKEEFKNTMLKVLGFWGSEKQQKNQAKDPHFSQLLQLADTLYTEYLKHHPQDETPTSTKYLVEPLGDEDMADELHRDDREESAKLQRKSRRLVKKSLKLRIDDEEAEKRKEEQMNDINRQIDEIGTPVGYDETWLEKEEAEEANNSKKKRKKAPKKKTTTTNQTKRKQSSKRGNKSSDEANQKKKAKLQHEGNKSKPPMGISIARVSTNGGRPPKCRYCHGIMDKPGELHMIRTSVSRANRSWKESAHFHFKCCTKVMTEEEKAQLLAIMRASDETKQNDIDNIVG